MASTNFRLGLFFVSTAVIFWSIAPIALKLSASFIDPVTLTWFRFLIAMIVSFFIQYYSGKLSEFKKLNKADWSKLVLAALFSIGNYISFVYCLDYLTPGQAQLNFQTAPFFMAIGGVLFFKEKVNAVQIMCFSTLALGMMLFFHPYIDFSQTSNNDIWLGVLIVQFSALTLSSYALVQKSLVQRLSSNNILLFVYGFGTLAMVPFSQWQSFTHMQSNDWIIALFCAAITLVAFGCFAQSMKYWPTSQVGPMVALTPILSITSTAIVASLGWWPEIIKADELDLLTILGMILVVISVFGIQLLPVLLEKRRSKYNVIKSIINKHQPSTANLSK